MRRPSRTRVLTGSRTGQIASEMPPLHFGAVSLIAVSVVIAPETAIKSSARRRIPDIQGSHPGWALDLSRVSAPTVAETRNKSQALARKSGMSDIRSGLNDDTSRQAAYCATGIADACYISHEVPTIMASCGRPARYIEYIEYIGLPPLPHQVSASR
jgi:hypothetical protein